jgi:hypothetical protein
MKIKYICHFCLFFISLLALQLLFPVSLNPAYVSTEEVCRQVLSNTSDVKQRKRSVISATLEAGGGGAADILKH